MFHRLIINFACLLNAHSLVNSLYGRPFRFGKDEFHAEAAALTLVLLFGLFNLLLGSSDRLRQLCAICVSRLLFRFLGCGTLGAGIKQLLQFLPLSFGHAGGSRIETQLDALVEIDPAITGGVGNVQFVQVVEEGPVPSLAVQPLELPKSPPDVVLVFDPGEPKAEDLGFKFRSDHFLG